MWFAAGSGFGAELDDLLAKAKEGDPVAQVEAADRYAKGRGVGKDLKAAVELYAKAAAQGSGDACMALGKLHLGGAGLPKNSTEAAKWFRMAADQGNAAAQCQMARMHLAGAGVPKDNVEACMWAKVAAAQGEPQSQRILAFLTPRMSAQQSAKAESLAQAILTKKAADAEAGGIPLVAPPLE
jgi:TPR repeat protein